jgi:TatD DNase family protein
MSQWLDAHTHLDSDELFHEKTNVLNRASQAGVQQILLVNSEAAESSFERTVECLRMEHPVRKFAAFGIHPHHASLYGEELEKRLQNLLSIPGVVALGEIGLDFYYDFSSREAQVRALRQQLTIARSNDFPVVIHCRDAYAPLAEILLSVSDRWRGMIHCFTGTAAEMQPLLDLGFHISFSGIVTFRKAEQLQDCARKVPIDRILIETDAPFLAPVPHRGKRNEPSYVVETGRFIATLRNISEEEFGNSLFRNFDALFLTGKER